MISSGIWLYYVLRKKILKESSFIVIYIFEIMFWALVMAVITYLYLVETGQLLQG